MTPYIPQLKVFVDWDGDGFINRSVPVGTPVNKVPYAPFPRALALRNRETGAYANKFLFDDAYALVAREVELGTNELALFGSEFDNRFRPSSSPSLVNSTVSSPNTFTSYSVLDDVLIWKGVAASQQSFAVDTYLYGASSTNTGQIPVVSGQTYTLMFYYKPYAAANDTRIQIYGALNTVRQTNNFSNQTEGWKSFTYTAAATENIKILLPAGNATYQKNIDYLGYLMWMSGSHTAPPTDGYNVWNAAPVVYKSPVVLEAGKDYTISFVISSETDAEVDIDCYLQSYGAVGSQLIHNAHYVLDAGLDTRVHLQINTLDESCVLVGVVENTDAAATIRMRGYQVVEGQGNYAFSVGETAAYDALGTDALAANWELGRRKFDEQIGYEGTAEITLYNRDRIYSPKNTESPLYGFLGKKNLLAYIELEHPTDFTKHVMFKGWTELIDVVVGSRSNQQARLTLRQGMFRLREGSFAPIVYESMTINDVLPTLIEMAGWRYASHPAQAVLDYEQRLGYNAFLPTDENIYEREEESLYTYDLVGQGWDDDTKISEALEDLLEAEGASFWLGREGKLNFVNRTFYLHRPEFMDYSFVIGATTQAGTYEYGRDVASIVSVFAKPKDTAKNQVIWSTKPAVQINAGQVIRIQMEFSFEGGEPRTITSVEGQDVTLSGYYNTKTRNTSPTQITSEDLAKIQATVETDYAGRYTLVLTNGTNRRVWVTAEVKGDYVVGGEGVTYEFSDSDAMLAANGIHRRKLTTFLLTTEEEAEGLARTVFLRDGRPDGEFTSFTVIGNTMPAVESLILMQTGDRLYVSENQTAETHKPHIVLGEEGSFSGNVLKIKYNIGRLDSTIYGYVGDELNHEFIDVMEGERFMIGTGDEESAYGLEADNLIKVLTFNQNRISRYLVGMQPKSRYYPAAGNRLPAVNSSVGKFDYPALGQNGSSDYQQCQSGQYYKFITTLYPTYSVPVAPAPPFNLALRHPKGRLQLIDGTSSAVYTFPSLRNYETIEGEFLSVADETTIIGQSAGYFRWQSQGDTQFGEMAQMDFWPKIPVTYLEPSVPYTLFIACRSVQNYAEMSMTARVIEVEPPPYPSGDGENTLLTLSFEPEFGGIGMHSATFTTPATSRPVRLELEFDTLVGYPRSIELFEFGLVAGSVAPTTLNTLSENNPNVIRLAV